MKEFLYTDISSMLRDFGMPVSDGTRTADGLLDAADVELLANHPSPLSGRLYVVSILTDSLDVAIGSIITVNGTPYLVRDKLQIDDGLITQLICAEQS